jgi:hypothetical protein
LREYGHLAKRLTVEVGCNDGDFLRHFAAAECPAIGVDPAAGPASAAQSRGLDVIVEPFGLGAAERIRDEHGPAGLVVANHVLAHVESVADVLAGIEVLLADDGIAYIEVQYLPDLLVNNAFDLVYHEHRNFFSLSSLAAALRRHELRIVDVELTDRQGGSLRVAVARGYRIHVERERVLASEVWLRGIEAYRGTQGRVERIRDRLCEILWRSDEPRVGYGAPAKATTLVNFCGIDRPMIDRVTDTTLAKQGQFIPGTSIPIVAPTGLGDPATILILAWNYAPQIIRNHPDYSGGWLVPIPSPVMW